MAEKVPKYSDPNSSGQIQSMLVNENLIAIWPEGMGDALESSESLKLALDTLQVHISNDAQGSFWSLEREIERSQADTQWERQESEKRCYSRNFQIFTLCIFVCDKQSIASTGDGGDNVELRDFDASHPEDLQMGLYIAIRLI